MLTIINEIVDNVLPEIGKALEAIFKEKIVLYIIAGIIVVLGLLYFTSDLTPGQFFSLDNAKQGFGITRWIPFVDYHSPADGSSTASPVPPSQPPQPGVDPAAPPAPEPAPAG